LQKKTTFIGKKGKQAINEGWAIGLFGSFIQAMVKKD
jgi:hypothetical protein